MSPDGEVIGKSSEPALPPEKEINGAWNLEGLEQVDEKMVHQEREALLKILEERQSGEVDKVDTLTQPVPVELPQLKRKDSPDKEKDKAKDDIDKLKKKKSKT